jgi:hypothetical protein
VADPPRRPIAACLAALCALACSACASTLEDRPVPHNQLEYLLAAPFPVYWLGGSFAGMQVREVVHDPSDAWSVQYGDCLEGGEGECVSPLQIVTSPDNSFLPGAATPTRRTRIRGVPARLEQQGRTIVIATGGVVVDVYARNARTAALAARTAVPINAPAAPGAPLAPALPNTRFGQKPLPKQVPSPLREAPAGAL